MEEMEEMGLEGEDPVVLEQTLPIQAEMVGMVSLALAAAAAVVVEIQKPEE